MNQRMATYLVGWCGDSGLHGYSSAHWQMLGMFCFCGCLLPAPQVAVLAEFGIKVHVGIDTAPTLLKWLNALALGVIRHDVWLGEAWEVEIRVRCFVTQTH